MGRKAVTFSDRPGFEARWRSLLEEKGFSVLSAAPDALPDNVAPGFVAIFDATAPAYDEDELLAAVGFAKARGAYTVLCAGDGSEPCAVADDDLFQELANGMIARNRHDRVRLAGALFRRTDASRSHRFEFVTVAPGGTELLAVLGDARCVTLSRPTGEMDDGSDVVEIALSEDAKHAELKLQSGKQLRLDANAVASHVGEAPNRKNGAGKTAAGEASAKPFLVEGPQLGARLRELRKAAGLTQAELARRTGIHRPNIARVEAGRHTPSLETLARLAEAIGVPTTDVFSQAD